MKTFFIFGEHLRLYPWSLALASSIPVLGLESVCPRKGCTCPWPWPRIFFVSLALVLASSLVSSTPPLCVTDKFALYIFLIVHKYFVFHSRSVLSYYRKWLLLNFIFVFISLRFEFFSNDTRRLLSIQKYGLF